MLHSKFQDHRTFGSGEDFYFIWTWRPSWSYDLDHLYTSKLSFPLPRRLFMKFYFDLPSGFRGEDLLNWLTAVDGRQSMGIL